MLGAPLREASLAARFDKRPAGREALLPPLSYWSEGEVRLGIGKGLFAAGRRAWDGLPGAAVAALSCRSRRGVGTRISDGGSELGRSVCSLESDSMVLVWKDLRYGEAWGSGEGGGFLSVQSAVLKWFGSRARGGIALLEQRVLLAGGIRAAVGAIVRVFRRRQELLTAGVGRSYGEKEALEHPETFQARLARALGDLMELWCPSSLRGGWTR